jgi:vacuolar-type H+-ATPase subunit F/Vma7
MSRVVALGPSARVAGFALAGVTVLETDEDGVLGAWGRLPDDTGLLLLTPDAVEALKERLAGRERVLWAQIPT